MKRSFFQAAVVSILLYGCTTWALTKRLEKKLDGSYTRMLREILNKSWRQHPTRHQLYCHLHPITKTIKVRGTRHAGHCRSCVVLLWTPSYGRAKAGRPARTYIQQLCEDTGWSPEDMPEAKNDKEKWRERVRDIRGSGTTWCWWWLFPYCLCMETILNRLSLVWGVASLTTMVTWNTTIISRHFSSTFCNCKENFFFLARSSSRLDICVALSLLLNFLKNFFSLNKRFCFNSPWKTLFLLIENQST